MSAAIPLSAVESEEFNQLMNARIRKVKEKTQKVFDFQVVDSPPCLVNSAFYHLFGHQPENIPADIFDDPRVMMQFQERIYYEQMSQIDDDFVPYLMPWFGTIVTASAFGCKIEFPPGQDPAANPRYYPITTPSDVRALQVPDVENAGLMPRVLAFQKYMKENSFLPVGLTDMQGPLTTANQLLGYDKLIYLMADYPDLTHQLMAIITETLILWIKKQKQVIGEAFNHCIGDQQVFVGEHAGIWLSDDDAVLMSPKTYREFVVPYNSQILEEFGGGCLHYCGNATHQTDNFLATKGLKALNIYLLSGIDAFVKLQQRVQDKIVLFACDFTPVEYEKYFVELIAKVNLRGLVIDSQISPVVGLLEGGKYTPMERDLVQERFAVFSTLKKLLQKSESPV